MHRRHSNRQDTRFTHSSVVSRWSWIRKKQKQYAVQRRETYREYVDGETHFFDGNRYLLSVTETNGAARVRIAGNGRIQLLCRHGASHTTRQGAFDAFYRTHLRELVGEKMPVYASALEVNEPEVRMQRMRTKWGSCNANSRRILINLELAKKPSACVEYILAHELTHLRVRHHNAEFRALLEDVMPDWRHRRDVLNSLPLSYDEWDY